MVLYGSSGSQVTESTKYHVHKFKKKERKMKYYCVLIRLNHNAFPSCKKHT